MLVEPDGRIEDLYYSREMPEIHRRAVADGQRIIDFGGATLLPAFTDAHVHFMPKIALSALGVRLGRFSEDRMVPDTLEGVGELLRAHARMVPRGPVFGYGLFPGAVKERRMPYAEEIEHWLPGRVVAIFSLDGHASSYSPQALRQFKLAALADRGILVGEAHEFNIGVVTDYLMASMGAAELARGLSRTLTEAAMSGLASIHCLEGFNDAKKDQSMSLFTSFASRLPLHLRLYPQYTDIERVATLLPKMELPRAGGCLAWEMDGSISSRTAALDYEYLDTPGWRGSLYRDPAGAYELVAPFVKAGYQTAVHAIGSAAIESILTAYEILLEETGDSRNKARLRIEHFELPRPDQIERAGALGIVTVMQPGFLWADSRFLHSYEEALDRRTRSMMIPLRSMLEAGCRIALSTDSPVQDFSPFVQIAGAVGHPDPAERLTLYEALCAASWGGAYACFDDGRRGVLDRNRQADFVVLDIDPFEVDPEYLHLVEVRETWIDGNYFEPPNEKTAKLILNLVRRKGRKI